jgi:uncharacterized membrane protein
MVNRYTSTSSSGNEAAGILLTMLGIVALVLLLPIVGTCIGAFCGYVVGLVFPEAIIDTLSRLGMRTQGLEMWQLGACLGFIGGFFRTSVHK